MPPNLRTLLDQSPTADRRRLLTGLLQVLTRDPFEASNGSPNAHDSVDLACEEIPALGRAAIIRRRLSRELGVDLPASLVVDQANLDEACEALLATLDLAAARPAEAPVVVRASPLQRGLFFLENLGAVAQAYHLPILLELTGRLDEAVLENSLQAVVARHEALRTVFTERDGEPFQSILPRLSIGLRRLDLSALTPSEGNSRLEQILEEEFLAPFDLRDGPLLRAFLVRLAPQKHVFGVILHHLAADGPSLRLFTTELARCYEKLHRSEPPPPPPAVQYQHFSQRLRAGLTERRIQDLLAWWRGRLDGIEPLDLPLDFPRPAVQTYRGASQPVTFSEPAAAALRDLASRRGATPLMLAIAVFAVLLHRYTGQTSIVLGTPASVRDRDTEAAVIGMFANMLVFPVRFEDGLSFVDVLDQVRQHGRQAYRMRDLPFERLVQELEIERNTACHPIFQASVALGDDESSLTNFTFGSVEAAVGQVAPRAVRFDLELRLRLKGSRLEGELLYATRLFTAATAGRMAGHLTLICEALARNPEQPVSQLRYMREDERQALLVPARKDHADPRMVPELFERQAASTPDAPALRSGELTWTYRELDQYANGLAHRLQPFGVRADTVVALCLERSAEMTGAILAVLKAGGAFLPLDPDDPPGRLQRIVDDAGPALVVTTRALIRKFSGDLPALLLDQDAPPACASPPRLESAIHPGQLAYVLYTSGSTGQPKGVMVGHGALANHMNWMCRDFPLQASDRLLQKTPYTFDASLWEFFLPLLCGGQLVMARPGGHRDLDYLVEVIRRENITVLQLVPSVLRQLLEEEGFGACGTLRKVFCGGEVLTSDLRDRFFATLNAELNNLYGPTETCIQVSAASWRSDDAAAPISIGRPVDGTSFLVLDRFGELQPTGVQGELYIGGSALARGYRNAPELTAAAFVPRADGTVPGDRLYRTGDLVRRQPDGTYQYLGRIGRRLKIRGLRIEPSEIESCLRVFEGVTDALVTVRTKPGADPFLVAYLSGNRSRTDVAAIQTYLSESLPAYMVPDAFEFLGEMPRTPSGKIDQAALPAPSAMGPYPPIAGRSPIEEMVRSLFTELLRAAPVGVRSNFFRMGGNSLMAMRLISRLRKLYDVELPLQQLFRNPTVAHVATWVERQLGDETSRAITPPRPYPKHDLVPASFAQSRLWFLEQMGQVGSAYHTACHFRLRGRLDVVTLQGALTDLVDRQEALRTTLSVVDGLPKQRILAPFEVDLPVTDLENLAAGLRDQALVREMSADFERRFDLEAGPVFRARLIRLGADHHVLLLTLHHICSDDWSISVLTRELSELYAARRDPARATAPARSSVQYADYTLWQFESMQAAYLDRLLSYWRRQLKDIEPLSLPTDAPRPRLATYRSSVCNFQVPAEVAAALNELAGRHGFTLYMGLLATLQAMLYRYSGQAAIAVGSPVANRHHGETENLVGFFVNMLVMQVQTGDDPAFLELLKRVRKAVLEAFVHQDLPFDKLVEALRPERRLDLNPLFEVVLVMHDGEPAVLRLPDIVVEPVTPREPPVHFDLEWHFTRTGDELRGACVYRADLFKPPTIEAMTDCFLNVLRSAIRAPQTRLSGLSVSDPQQFYRQSTALPQRFAFEHVQAKFEEQAALRGAAVAVSCRNESLTYQDLNSRANVLAHRLMQRGVGPEVRVAVLLDRSPQAVVAILAVVKAGGVYVPLDPQHPAARHGFVIDDSGAALLVTSRPLLESLDNVVIEVLDIDHVDVPHAAAPNPPTLTKPCNGIYLIYTSGSTGHPKGVLVTHDSLARLFSSTAADFRFSVDDVWTCFHSLAFDFSVWEIWGCLLHGGRLVMAPYWLTRDSLAFRTLLLEERVTILNQTPSAFRQLVRCDLERETADYSLRTIIFGGEHLEVQALSGWLDRYGDREPRLINMYGITETCVHVTYRPIGRADLDRSAAGSLIGRPLADLTVHILGKRGEMLPPGVAGEIHVGGPGVARGYLNRPDLTGARFVPDPFASTPGARLYRSGDKGRMLPGGTLEYLGRLDSQIKLHGFRIEPGEVEARLRECPAISDAVVTLCPAGNDELVLAAYVVLVAPASSDRDMAWMTEVREFVAGQLPAHMRPGAYIALDFIPLNANGKADLKALPAPGPQARQGNIVFAGSRSPIEFAIVGIYSELLGVDQPGIHDNFFHLGGHSLLATQAVSRIRDTFGIEFPLLRFFEMPTPAAVAAWIEQHLQDARNAGVPAMSRVERRPWPLSFAQSRLWFLEQTGLVGHAYHISMNVEMEGSLDIAALRRAFTALLLRHEALRTRFGVIDGEPHQIVDPIRDFDLPLVDVSRLDADSRETAAQAAIVDCLRSPFNLQTTPLMRARLLQMDAEGRRHLLLTTIHHIVADGWSVGILARELSVLYHACREGRRSPLAELPLQYLDFSVWQRRWLQDERLGRELDFWRDQLRDVPPLKLPIDRPRPAVESFRGDGLRFTLEPDLAAAVKAIGRTEKATLFMVLLAAFQALLHRYTGQERIAVGSPIANRNRSEIEQLIGFFVNSQVICADFSGGCGFREMLRRIRSVTLGAYANQNVPFERIVEALQPERNLNRNPLFQVVFALQQPDAVEPQFNLEGLRTSLLQTPEHMVRFDLEMHLWPQHGTLMGVLNYNVDLFDRQTIEGLIGCYRKLLRSALREPDRPIGMLALADEGDVRQAMLQCGEVSTPYPQRAIHELFEEQAASDPCRTALTFRDQVMSYGALNRAANRLARFLRQQGVGAETRVALVLERSPRAVIAILAVHKAGGAYVPLDPGYPARNIAELMNYAGASVALLDCSPIESAQFGAIKTIVFDESLWTGYPDVNLDIDTSPDQLAYIMFTSGSTGFPKGVAVPHRGVVRLVKNTNLARFDPGDVMMLLAPLSFDASTLELWSALLNGGRLHIFSEPIPSLDMLGDCIENYGITTLWMTAGLFHQMVDARCQSLRKVRRLFTGGDVVSAQHVRRLLADHQGTEVINGYGPTESTTFTTCHIVVSIEKLGGTVPIGKPISNSSVYLLDGGLNFVPPGLPGDLYAGGAGLARGYFNRPGLTAECFIPNPYARVPGERLYRTGDRARYRPDGSLEFLGRADRQVKLRGFRVEPGELEFRLRTNERLLDAVVTLRDDAPGGRGLAAYLVPNPRHLDSRTLSSEQVGGWARVFDDRIYVAESAIPDALFNTTGWVSSYDGRPLPEAQMRIWAQDVIANVLAARPRRVLEIGCGTGMLLFQIAPQCELYLGTDFSAKVLAEVGLQLQRLGPSFAHVRVENRAADNFAAFERNSFDVVILSSVVQYFPSVQYLLDVLEGALGVLRPGGRIVLGDVRNVAYLRTFHTGIHSCKAEDGADVEDLKRRILVACRDERELLIDPEFFAVLPSRFPEIAAVEIRLQPGREHNELNKFRYTALLHAGSSPGMPARFEHKIDGAALDLAEVKALLRNAGGKNLLITGLANARLTADLADEQLIFGEATPQRVNDLRQALRQEPAPSIDPETLIVAGAEADYDTLVRWTGAEPAGRMDAAFIFRDTAAGEPFWPVPAPLKVKPWHQYANNPLESRFETELIAAVKGDLKASVPDHLMPYAFVVMEKLPLTANGKLDVRALPVPVLSGLIPGRKSLQPGPRDPVEEVIADIWGAVLGLASQQIGGDSHFFELGGHSLLLIRIVSRLKSTFQIEIPVRKMFENPTVAGVAKALTALEPKPGYAVAVAKLRLRLMRMSSREIEALTRTRKQIAKG